MELIQWAFWVLAAAAAGGLLFGLLSAMKVRYPSWFGLGHGVLGLTGLIMLGYALYTAGPDTAIPQTAYWALGLLGAAFLGGALFFGVVFRHAKPRWAIVTHGGLALAGAVVLFFSAY
jgi:peptidoglycan/LPS O-acetylase OafA/YrhL